MEIFTNNPLIDSFGRKIEYVRISVTDRCDLRCHYCMCENPKFLPRNEILSFEETENLIEYLISRGVRKIRITGGEPLVRRGIEDFLFNVGQNVENGLLEELTLTTNGTQLAGLAKKLALANIRRINVSLDTLSPEKFTSITRGGKIEKVFEGIKAAQAEGIKIKLNCVVLRHDNLQEIPQLIEFAQANNFDISFIETMPMGEVKGRESQYVATFELKDRLKDFYDLIPNNAKTAGPSKYYQIKENGALIGFITPLSENFCASCNRVRITCTGQVFMCLGRDENIDLRAALRAQSPKEALDEAFAIALKAKAKAHDFAIEEEKTGFRPSRLMSATGG